MTRRQYAWPAACVVAGMAALAGAGLLADQDPDQAEPAPTFRARIDSVSVDVIVTDDDGDPVGDLTPEDFEVYEDGVRQTIDTFEYVDVDAAAASRPTTSGSLASPSAQAREVARSDNRVFVIFLDDYHVHRDRSLQVRQQLGEFLSRLGPNDLVALATPLSSVGVLTFSRNHAATASELRGFEGRKYDYTPRNPYEQQFQSLTPQQHELLRNDLVMTALRSLCVYLGSLRDGRKTVLYVSEGLNARLPAGVRTRGTPDSPIGPVGFGEPRESLGGAGAFFDTAELDGQMRRVHAAAARSNTAIYAFDPRGLAAVEFSLENAVSDADSRRVRTDAQQMLRALAGETDGRAIVNQNDPLPGLVQMVRDASSYYLLGYTSTESPRDGEFQPIEVRVRREDVDVRARRGYWALTEEDVERASAASRRPEVAADVQDALQTLAESNGAQARRAIDAWAGALPAADGSAAVTVAWKAVAAPGTSTQNTVSRVQAEVRSSSGDEVFAGDVPEVEALGQVAGVATFSAPPGLVQVRLTAENARGRRLDVRDLVVEIPDVRAEPVYVSTPIVFRGRTARDMQTLRSNPDALPAVERVFYRTERLLLRFAAGGQSTPVGLAVRLLNSTGEVLAELPEPVASAPGRYESEIALGSLPPGDYLIEVAAGGAEQGVRELVAIRVAG